MSLSAEISRLAALWLKWDANATTRAEITALVEARDEAALAERLATRIAFGTAGLRGPMRAGFSAMNDLTVIQASQGFVSYLLSVRFAVAAPSISTARRRRCASRRFPTRAR